MLMVIFGIIELSSVRNFCSYFQTTLFQQGNQFLCNFFLIIIQIENLSAVLIPDIWSLSVNLGWIMCFKKQLTQRFIICFGRIKNNSYRFSMPCSVRTYFFVC